MNLFLFEKFFFLMFSVSIEGCLQLLNFNGKEKHELILGMYLRYCLIIQPLKKKKNKIPTIPPVDVEINVWKKENP